MGLIPWWCMMVGADSPAPLNKMGTINASTTDIGNWQKADPVADACSWSIFRRSGHQFVEENATKQEVRAPIRFHRIGMRSRAFSDEVDTGSSTKMRPNPKVGAPSDDRLLLSCGTDQVELAGAAKTRQRRCDQWQINPGKDGRLPIQRKGWQGNVIQRTASNTFPIAKHYGQI